MRNIFKKILKFGLTIAGVTTKIFPQSLLISIGAEVIIAGVNRIDKYANSKSKKAGKATDKIVDIMLVCAEHSAKNNKTDFDDRLVRAIKKKR